MCFARLVPDLFIAAVGRAPTLSHVEHRDSANGRGRALAHFHRQADEGELPLTKQRLQIAQALNRGDVEIEAGFVYEQVDVTHRARPHRVDAEMHHAAASEPFSG